MKPTRYPGSFLQKQKQDGLGYLNGFAGPVKGMKGVEALQGLVQLCGLNENFLDGRFHNCRPNGVHPDVVLSQFHGAGAG